jgi:hypothetical protein
MSNQQSSGFSTLLKWGLAAAVVYAAYKVGQKSVTTKEQPVMEPVMEPVQEPDVEIFNDEADEEIYVVNVLQELMDKKNKTKQDRYNIGLLEVKLKQLRREK